MSDLYEKIVSQRGSLENLVAKSRDSVDTKKVRHVVKQIP
jgi:hypothetical protein